MKKKGLEEKMRREKRRENDLFIFIYGRTKMAYLAGKQAVEHGVLAVTGGWWLADYIDWDGHVCQFHTGSSILPHYIIPLA
jgi:hypothetical protein